VRRLLPLLPLLLLLLLMRQPLLARSFHFRISPTRQLLTIRRMARPKPLAPNINDASEDRQLMESHPRIRLW
jgi:hypothetical protein